MTKWQGGCWIKKKEKHLGYWKQSVSHKMIVKKAEVGGYVLRFIFPPEDKAMIDLCPTIAGVRLPFCLMNAAGALSTSREELFALAHSDAGAVVTKSITPESFLDPGATCGIENPGVTYYVNLLPELRRVGKPVMTSVAGLRIEEFVRTAQILATAGADLIEVNLNDPQVHTHLAPFASADNLSRIVSTMRRAVAAPLVVKLPAKVSLPLATVTAILLDAGILSDGVSHHVSHRRALTSPNCAARLTWKA